MSIPSWIVWRVGMRVECINDEWRKGANMPFWRWLNCLVFGLPVVGGVYTVTEVGKHQRTGHSAICLKGWGTLGFHTDFFRPLVEDGSADEIEAKLYQNRHRRATRKVSA